MSVSLEFTPNPNTLKYVVDKALLEKGVAHFSNQESAKHSDLASRIFKNAGVTGVMIGSNFVTVTKSEQVEWDQIHSYVEADISAFVESAETAVSSEYMESILKNHQAALKDLGSVEAAIIKILDDEIRPAVAMDGGDITFDKYADGTVYLFMQGSCAGCPSSVLTLKMGIETRLKELIPEIKEVVAI